MIDDTTAPRMLDDGIALVLAAEESGEWKPVIDWLTSHPEQAAGLAAFLAGDRQLKAIVAPVPQAIPGLELAEEIGRGGFGIVFRARSLTLNREVAVKLVQAFDEEDRRRFRVEAEAIAGLDHPNVVPVHDSGETGGMPYLVMKLMPGRLRHDGPMPPREAAKLVAGIARGVHHAHKHGLIHRDLKPDNVLLDEDGSPRIADFGLARRFDASMTNIAGTIPYMAPEQASEKRLTTAVDIWALGVILYELLQGKRPFDGGTVTILLQIADEPPPPLRPDVPGDLGEVCLRCLEKHPADRYGSAQELADNLERYLAGEPVNGRSGWTWSALWHGLGRRPHTDSMGSWYVLLWGAASVLLWMFAWQFGLMTSGVAVAGYFAAWAAILWLFMFSRWDRLNPVERNSSLVQIAMILSCAACLPSAGDLVRVLPIFLCIKGLAIFVHGSWYWGRFYLVGMLYFVLGAALPLLPAAWWPGAFGLLSGGFQAWAAMHLRHVHTLAR